MGSDCWPKLNHLQTSICGYCLTYFLVLKENCSLLLLCCQYYWSFTHLTIINFKRFYRPSHMNELAQEITTQFHYVLWYFPFHLRLLCDTYNFKVVYSSSATHRKISKRIFLSVVRYIIRSN